MKVGINMSLIARFDGNMNVIGRLLKDIELRKIYLMKNYLQN